MSKIKLWLRLFRAQTWPATMLLIMVPYLYNSSFLKPESLLLFVSTFLFHYLMFGQNSLMDMTQGYDQKDPSKSHHPLITGEISVTAAHNVIHWGLALATVWAAVFTLWVSPSPALATVFLLVWVVFGWGYNVGLSKESRVGFLSLTIGYTGMGGWAWLLSNEVFTPTALWYLAYAWMTLVFQISWEGYIKEMDMDERSNILKRMGARVTRIASIPAGLDMAWFEPGYSIFYGAAVKAINLGIVYPIILLNPKPFIGLWYQVIGLVAVFYAYRLLAPRPYDRNKELMNMSIEEIATIYLIVPTMIAWPSAIVLMVVGVLYFFGINKILWETPYPKV